MITVGRSGALVESMLFDRRVAGSNRALAAHVGTIGKSFTCSCLLASACKLRHSVNCCGRERFCYEKRYRNG